MAIDPKGVVGEPAYEVARFLHNPIPRFLEMPSPRDVILNRVAILADSVNLDRERILSWGFCKTVLSAWWNIEDNGAEWDYLVACAKEFDRIVE